MNIDDIRHVLVIGGGTMGRQIAFRCAVQGYDVTVYDVSPDALKNAAAKMKADAAQRVDEKRLTQEEANASLARVRFSNNPEDAADADLVSESVPEDPDLKAKVFAQFNAICPPRTIFATNTSTLLPSMFATATGRPDRFAAMHFYNVWDAKLADIMPHPGTNPETVQLLQAFAKRLGQLPLVLKKENPSYVGNVLINAMSNVAFRLFKDGVASAEDIDRAAMIVMGTRMGPFGLWDFDGLDTIWQIAQTNARISGDPEAQANADWFKKEYIDKGWLGVKSGRGFYTYPDPAFSRPGFLTGEPDAAKT